MGLLTLGTPLTWEEAKKHADQVRSQGIQQFIRIFNRVKDRQRDVLLWGDEIEYMLLEFDPISETVKVSLRAQELLKELKGRDDINSGRLNMNWAPEYARYMIEGTPVGPRDNL
jgi:glutamate--cysteine ligase catalytic subunit